MVDEAFCEVFMQCIEAEDSRVFQVNPDIIVRQIGDEWLLIPTGEFAQHFNGMISLNEFSHFVWQQLEQPLSVREVLNAVQAEYEDEDNTMEIEVRRLMEDYVNLGLFREVIMNTK